MDDDEQMPEIPPPAIVVAFIASLISLMLVYWVARPAVERLEDGWVQLLVYAFVPMTTAFVILYRSDWHPEITGVARTCSLLLLSGIIFIGVLIACGVMLCIGLFYCVGLSNNQGP
jgi:hypothetical protein